MSEGRMNHNHTHEAGANGPAFRISGDNLKTEDERIGPIASALRQHLELTTAEAEAIAWSVLVALFGIANDEPPA